MEQCGYCGMIHGTKCPLVKSIEYHSDGTVKRVEFFSRSDNNIPTPTYPQWPGPTYPWQPQYGPYVSYTRVVGV